MKRKLKIPETATISPYRPPKELELPEGVDVPFIGGKGDAPERQLQEDWEVKVGVFRLPGDEEEYQKVWQECVHGRYKLCKVREEFDANSGCYVAFLRYAIIRYRLPEETGGTSSAPGAEYGVSDAKAGGQAGEESGESLG